METTIFRFKNHHMPPSKSWFLLKPFILLLCLILVFLKLKSVTRKASVVLLLIMFTLSIISTFLRLLVMILSILLWQILIILNTLFVWGRLITLQKPSKHFRTLSTPSSVLKQYVISSRLKACDKRKRPLLKPHYRRIKLKFAKRHLEWIIEDLEKVMWSNETKNNYLGSDDRTYV
jgi:hypothetical protein